MWRSSSGPEAVRVSEKGQATIPKPLRETFGIAAPGEVFVYEADGRIVVEPVPSLEELHGIHAGDREPGEVLDRVAELREADDDATLVAGGDDFDSLPADADVERFRDHGV